MITTTISAVIPTYNRAAYVTRAIDSILRQSRLPDEIIVVDDGSTDGTADKLEHRYGRRVCVIRQANGGVSRARRIGIEVATGEWIAFLDSDDEWLPGRLEAMAEIVEALPADVAWLFGDTAVQLGDGSYSLYASEGLGQIERLKIYPDALETQFPYMFSLLQSSLVRRTALIETGAFLEGLRASEDLLAAFRVALRAPFAATTLPVTRLDRTGDATDSLNAAQRDSVDYHRARLIAYGEAARVRRRGPWARQHERAAQGLLRASLRGDQNPMPAALEQFRHGFSLKACALMTAALVWRVRRSVSGARVPAT